MTFDQLQYFIAAADYDTFFEAAEALHVAQSTLSKQIIRLEQELGVPLMDRSHRSAALTEAGKIFYHDAKELTAQYQNALLRVRQYSQRSQSELCLASLPILDQYHFTESLNAFSYLYPDIRLFLDEVEEQELLDGLQTGRFHLAIARQNILNPAHYDSWPLATDRLVAVLFPNHPLASRSVISLEDLADEPFILMNRYTSIYQLCIKLFQERSVPFHLIRTARPSSIIRAVSLGEGISLLAESSLRYFSQQQTVSLPLHPPVPLSVVLAKKKTAVSSAASKKLIQFLTNQ